MEEITTYKGNSVSINLRIVLLIIGILLLFEIGKEIFRKKQG